MIIHLLWSDTTFDSSLNMSHPELNTNGFLLCIKINNIHDISIASVMDGTNSLMLVRGAEGVSLH